MTKGSEMLFDIRITQTRMLADTNLATADRAPNTRLARAGVAAANGGFDPERIGGNAACWVQGRSVLPDELFINSIVGQYCVSSHWGRQ